MTSRKMTPTATPGIFKRENRYVVVLRDRSGKQFKRSARTLAEARQLSATLRADVVRGELPSEMRRTTFAEYAREWIETYTGRTSRGIRYMTLQNYRDALERHAIPFLGRSLLTDIEPRDVKALAARIAASGVSNNTVRLHLAPVRALFATAFEEGLIRSNPTSGLRNTWGRQPDAEPRRRALTDPELARVIDEVPDNYRLLIELMSHTGLRIGEALGLQWRDLDLDRRIMQVRRRLYEGKLDTPKSRFGIRDLPLTTAITTGLREFRDACPAEDRDFVFESRAGTPLEKHNILQRVFKPAARRAGVPWANLHTLRHTCASRLFRNGWNAKQVQMMLGHHSPAFTLDVYVHVMPSELPTPEFLAELPEFGAPGRGGVASGEAS
jgi:integrase